MKQTSDLMAELIELSDFAEGGKTELQVYCNALLLHWTNQNQVDLVVLFRHSFTNFMHSFNSENAWIINPSKTKQDPIKQHI